MATSAPPPPTIKAKGWVLMDAQSGQILAEHDPDIELPPASLTKMMTMYLIFEDLELDRLQPDEQVTVSTKAWKMGGSRMFIEPRHKPTVDELLHGISTLSGNDASVALAEHIAGTEEAFADRMNQKAAELNMEHSHFVNATGFPAKRHYSSPEDMAILGAALARDFPERYKLFSEKSFTYNDITQSNRNRLLWSDPRVDGIKTGHTEKAGYCLVSSAELNGLRLVAAVFGAGSEKAREQQSRLLLNFGFRNFVALRPTERELRRKVEVFEGEEDEVTLLPAKRVWITIPKGKEKHIAFRLRYEAPLKAPIAKGQTLGTVEAVLMDGKKISEVLASVEMQAAKDVPQASWFGRQWDGVRLWWREREAEESE
jgi:D-alanyl-D-alanine carboxypeptidase (penicillin-binding protein 5/6)